ncbi:MAG: 4-(cytidine 5'-diphospho)-2-C-methyl-D-erythritol kinase [Clostridiales bacterium]|jgi:4-diphosphocytidyl-2-C-methyl-D-erythritol kinase|nr:4-(cytidine 5'-diphospho)-2-C-methyl-D-erythritol kinase [Clostridiales bacterium]
MQICALAPAKINLFLDVGLVQADGYHTVCSVMQTVSLYDTITVEKAPTGITLQCSDSALPCNEKNLAYRAAQTFFRESGIENAGVSITLEKKIPVASGLAGGSADAGAVLLLLHRLFDSPISMDTLLHIGGSLGADIPFCMIGSTALCRGRGEIVTPLPPLKPTHVVIARGGAGVSTPAAYHMLDAAYGKSLPAKPERWDIQHIQSWKDIQPTMFNIFESVILPVHKEASAYKKILEEAGACVAMMSGSGPAVFGLFESEAAAKHAVTKLQSIGAAAFLCKTCAGPHVL